MGKQARPTGEAMKTRMVRCWCECNGYVLRTTRTHLLRFGAPLCPTCRNAMQSAWTAPEGHAIGEGLGDFMAGLDAAGAFAGEGPTIREVESRYVTLRKARTCGDCGREHQRGWAMHLCVGSVGRELRRGYFCAEGCHAPAASELPGGVPRGFRLTVEHGNDPQGFSASGWAEGFGTGARS